MILAGAGTGWLPHENAAPLGMPASADYPSSLPPEQLQGGSLLYRNEHYRFSLTYPDDLIINEYAENGGGRTITFQTKTNDRGFEIFIIPYSGQRVSEERFKLDEPSGVRKQLIAIVIDGTPATMFFGNNAIMGNTREVWFIKNGFLYEVATYKPLDAWLAAIMRSWKFL
jgi:hypothetical protein